MSWFTDNWIELFGAVCGLVYVVLEIRQKIMMWLIGVINSLVYVWVFFAEKFYAGMILSAYYVLMSVYGYRKWKKMSGNEEEDIVSRLKLRRGIILLIAGGTVFLLTAYLLKTYTDSPIPYYDAFSSVFGLLATWMVAHKIVEAWYVWIVVNFFSAYVYFNQDLYPTFVLYFVYAVMSVIGLIRWKNQLLPDDKRNFL